MFHIELTHARHAQASLTLLSLNRDLLYKALECLADLACHLEGVVVVPTCFLTITKRGYNVFRLCADAELAAPDAHAAGDVVAGVASLVLAPRTLVEDIGNP